jgi:beta-glucanase (GH16 family)
MKKKIATLLLVVAGLAPALYGCSQTSSPYSSSAETSSSVSSVEKAVSISEASPTELDVGDTVTLLANSSNVIWTGDDADVATVTATGSLTGVRSGMISVTATSASDKTNSASYYVTVTNSKKMTVTITTKTSTVAVGSSFKFTATITGDSSNSGILWQVSNTAMAHITSDGTLTPFNVGKGTIVVTAYSAINPDAYYNVSVTITKDASGNSTIGDIETVDGYKLMFEDNFDGTRLNLNNWEIMTGDGSAFGNPGWGNGEAEFYKGDNLKIIDGVLQITAKTCESIKGKTYSSGRIYSKGKVFGQYGRIEARISCPYGNGLWPAFWMLPESTGAPYGAWPNSGEIDIMEAKGRMKYSTDGTLHYATPDGDHIWGNGSYVMPDGQDIHDFHTYAVEWDIAEIRFYVDNNLYYTANATENPWTVKTGTGTFPAPFDKPFHILLNMAIGGNYDSNRVPSASELPAKMRVDYVKWFQK